MDDLDKSSISIAFVHAALAPVVARGLDPRPLLLEANIPAVLLDAPQARVTPDSFSALWLGVARVLDDALFGQDSRRMKLASFSLLCHTLIHCDTLHGALLRMTQFFNVLLDDAHCALTTDDQHAHLTIRQSAGMPEPHVFGHETLLTMQHGVACWLIGRRIPILSASFAYPEPAHSAEYRRMFCDTLAFGQPATVLTIERALLILPIARTQRHAQEFLRGAPGNLVVKYKNNGGLAAKIRRRLRAESIPDWPDFDALALSLRMPPSTLRRRLAEEGRSFQLIKDQLRREMAIDLLCCTDKSIAEISGALGFAEPSAFHRAFKKWTGANPGAYRESGRAG